MSSKLNVLNSESDFNIEFFKFHHFAVGLLEGSFEEFFIRKAPEYLTWHKTSGNMFLSLDEHITNTKKGIFPKFLCEIQVTDKELNFLVVRMLTSESLDVFINDLKAYISSREFKELFKENCVEFDP